MRADCPAGYHAADVTEVQYSALVPVGLRPPRPFALRPGRPAPLRGRSLAICGRLIWIALGTAGGALVRMSCMRRFLRLSRVNRNLRRSQFAPPAIVPPVPEAVPPTRAICFPSRTERFSDSTPSRSADRRFAGAAGGADAWARAGALRAAAVPFAATGRLGRLCRHGAGPGGQPARGGAAGPRPARHGASPPTWRAVPAASLSSPC